MLRLAVILALLAGAASAAPICDERAKMAAELSGRYGESVRFGAVTKGGKSLLEVWANDAKGTWSLTITTPDGRMCLRSAGDAFSVVAPRAQGEDS